jgi:hypothetical protein
MQRALLTPDNISAPAIQGNGHRKVRTHVVAGTAGLSRDRTHRASSRLHLPSLACRSLRSDAAPGSTACQWARPERLGVRPTFPLPDPN